MPLSENQADWEITPDGLYVATRQFLLRRGYCCANRCRNCPYINWREQPDWQHAPHEAPRRISVSPRVLSGVQSQLARHERALRQAKESEQAYHLDMVEHYRLLLKRWNA